MGEVVGLRVASGRPARVPVDEAMGEPGRLRTPGCVRPLRPLGLSPGQGRDETLESQPSGKEGMSTPSPLQSLVLSKLSYSTGDSSQDVLVPLLRPYCLL